MSEKNLLIYVIAFVTLYIALCIFLICAVAKSASKKEKKKKFDERQIIAQGTAYKAAFWTMLIYYMLHAIISGAAGIVWCDEFLGMFLGVIVGVTVFVLICIFRDAYFRLDQTRVSVVIMLNVICLSQGIIGFLHVSDGTVVENGVLTGDATQLFLLLMGLIVDVAFIVKHRMEKRCEQECTNEES